MKRYLVVVALASAAALALPAHAVDWKQVRRDEQVMLWVDIDSIGTTGNETKADYMVDFRQAVPAPNNKYYRSIVVRTKIKCKDKQMSTLHTDGYSSWSAGGIIVAKTEDTAQETAWHPLEKDTSDEDVWRYVCEVRHGSPPPKTPPPKAAPPKTPPKK
jgi:surface-adhesin protein E